MATIRPHERRHKRDRAHFIAGCSSPAQLALPLTPIQDVEVA